MAFRPRPTVLIAEDNPVIALSYEEIVIDPGLSVGGSFLSCKSAEECLDVHNPDVAILDVTLQDGNSAQLAKKLCGTESRFLSFLVIRPNRRPSTRFSNPRVGWKSQLQLTHWSWYCAA
jgi:DNA-binding response OmpR family regulator